MLLTIDIFDVDTSKIIIGKKHNFKGQHYLGFFEIQYNYDLLGIQELIIDIGYEHIKIKNFQRTQNCCFYFENDSVTDKMNEIKNTIRQLVNDMNLDTNITIKTTSNKMEIEKTNDEKIKCDIIVHKSKSKGGGTVNHNVKSNYTDAINTITKTLPLSKNIDNLHHCGKFVVKPSLILFKKTDENTGKVIKSSAIGYIKFRATTVELKYNCTICDSVIENTFTKINLESKINEIEELKI